MDTEALLARIAELARVGTPFVVATVVKTAGSTPRGPGAKMVVLGDGSTLGTVGGGKLELQVTRDAMAALTGGESKLVRYELRPQREEAGAEHMTLGMLCGGDAEVFFEVYGNNNRLLVIGGGHIGQKLAELARVLDFRVTVVDERPEMLTRERFPQADELVCIQPSGVAGRVPIGPHTAVVIVTHGHLHDKSALAAVIGTPAAYIGMIGSKNKVRTVMGELRAEGVDSALLDRVHAPIGLDLGGQKPAEIALSIMAEIVAEQYGASGLSMKASVR